MKKKIISLFITIFLLTGFTTIVQSIEIKNILSTNNYQESAESSESCIFESITLGRFISEIKEQLNKVPLSSRFKARLVNFIESGINEMEKMGINSEKNLLETEDTLSNGLFDRLKDRSHNFLMNFYPDSVDILTVIPPFEVNLSENNESENSSKKLEVFIKLIPVIDSITTENRIIFRILRQSSIVWPAIGGRILEDNSTTFILAFGPGIQWSWRLF